MVRLTVTKHIMDNSQFHQKARQMLQAVSYLSDLDDAALKSMEEAAFRREYDAEQVVLLEGEPCSGLYIVEDGWLKASKIGADGREQVLHMLGSGEAFNAISVFTETPNQATVTALERSTVWMVRREVLEKLIEEHPSLARGVVKDLAGRVQHLIRMVEDLSLRSVEARLARILLEKAQGEAVTRKRWATQAEIAARIGTVTDVLNRALRKLAEDGLIRVERHQIQILDKEGLKEIAQAIE